MRAFDIRVPPAYLTATMAVEWHVVGQVGTTNGAGMELTLSENGTHLFREDAGAGERTWTFASNDPRLRDGASLLLEPREGGIARELEYTVRLTFVVRDAPEGPGS